MAKYMADGGGKNRGRRRPGDPGYEPDTIPGLNSKPSPNALGEAPKSGVRKPGDPGYEKPMTRDEAAAMRKGFRTAFGDTAKASKKNAMRRKLDEMQKGQKTKLSKAPTGKKKKL